MTSGSPATSLVVSRAAAALLGCLAIAASCESSCENQDFTSYRSFDFELKPQDVTDCSLESEKHSCVGDTAFTAYNGKLTVDFALANRGNREVSIIVRATTITTVVDDDVGFVAEDVGDVGNADVGDSADAGDVGPAEDEISFGRRLYALAPGERVVGTFGEDELGSGIGVLIEVECTDLCSGTFEYTVLVTQHECRSDSQCSTDESCDLSVGRCTGQRCLDDDDCADDEICDALAGEQGRCSGVGFFCATPPLADAVHRRPGNVGIIALMAVAILWIWRRR